MVAVPEWITTAWETTKKGANAVATGISSVGDYLSQKVDEGTAAVSAVETTAKKFVSAVTDPAETAKQVAAAVKDSVVSGITDGISKAMSELFTAFAKALAAPIEGLFQLAGRAWVESKLDLNAMFTGGTSNFVTAIVMPITLFLLVGSIIFVGIKIAISPETRTLKEFATGLGIYALMSVSWFALVTLMVSGTDELAAWTVKRVGLDLTNLGKVITPLFAVPPGGLSGSILGYLLLLIVVAVLCFVITITQLFFLTGRAAILVILAGMGPVSASMAVTERGRQYMYKIIGWTVAFVLYKPVGALIYASAALMVSKMDVTAMVKELKTAASQDGTSYAGAFFTMFQHALMPLALAVMAVFALPALMRLIVPQVEPVLSGGGGMRGGLGAGAVVV